MKKCTEENMATFGELLAERGYSEAFIQKHEATCSIKVARDTAKMLMNDDGSLFVHAGRMEVLFAANVVANYDGRDCVSHIHACVAIDRSDDDPLHRAKLVVTMF
ncbi:MAG: hypothetical protein ACF8MF_06750 [Phycisphaerales bacterium JB052]